MAKFQYFGTRISNQNCIHKEFKNRQSTENAYFISPSDIYERKGYNIQNYNFASCGVCVSNLVRHSKGI
jgi:hypothetical protein